MGQQLCSDILPIHIQGDSRSMLEKMDANMIGECAPQQVRYMFCKMCIF